MKGVRARMRAEWVKAVLGKGCRFTVNQFKRARWRLAERGWLMAAPAEGSALEKVVAVNASSPGYDVVRAYRNGERWFDVEALGQAVGASIKERDGALRLGTLGFALLRVDGDRVELRAADPGEARLVNEVRLTPHVRRFSARRIIGDVFHLRQPNRSRVNMTDTRGRRLKDALRENWFIECEGRPAHGRSRLGLLSTWSFAETPPVNTGTAHPPPQRRRRRRRRF